MLYSLGFSPCPNDTYIFAALVNGWIDTHGIKFEVCIADVEYLNRAALDSELDFSKLSFGVLPYLSGQYHILNSGAAIGNACGPLLISRDQMELHELKDKVLGIPGKMTSAYMLYRMLAPKPKEVVEMVFSEIESSLLDGTIDAGLIIHENRFTYAQKGLQKIADIGNLWEEKTGLAVPLGVIAGKSSLKGSELAQVDSLIHDSLAFAHQHPKKVMEYVRQYAQEMDENVMKQHINLYVNENSLERSDAANLSISKFLEEAHKII